MHRLLRYGLVAVVTVALLSVAVHEAMARSGPPDPERCGTAELLVEPVEDDAELDEGADVRAYADLSPDERRAFDRARDRSEPVTVDPSLLVASNLTETFTADGHSFPVSALVRYEGTNYSVLPHFDDCPELPVVPRQANVLLYPFDAIYRAFSPLYLPGAAALGIAVAYHYVNEWLQFG
jgi:hypothetical protein